MANKSTARMRRSMKSKPTKVSPAQKDDSLPKPEDIDLEHLYGEQKSSL